MRQTSLAVSVKKHTPPEKNRHWNISFQSTKSGAGWQFPPLDCRARARLKGMCFFTGTGTKWPRGANPCRSQCNAAASSLSAKPALAILRRAVPGRINSGPVVRSIVTLRIVGPRMFESTFRNYCAKKLDGAQRKPNSFV